jgi:hypothetical protein
MTVLTGSVAAAARRAHGVLTRTELLAAGRSRHQILWAVRSGELIPAHPGVYRVAAAPRTWHQRVLVAVHAAGSGALASHRSASALWGLDGSTQGVPEVVTPRHLRSWAVDLGRRHESKDLHLADPTVRSAIPCTGVARTLVDLGAVVPAELVQKAIDDAIRRHLCTWDDLHHALAMHSRQGRNGVGPLRMILEECYGTVVPDSHFNRLVERLILANGLPQPNSGARRARRLRPGDRTSRPRVRAAARRVGAGQPTAPPQRRRRSSTTELGRTGSSSTAG